MIQMIGSGRWLARLNSAQGVIHGQPVRGVMDLFGPYAGDAEVGQALQEVESRLSSSGSGEQIPLLDTKTGELFVVGAGGTK